MQMGAVCIVLVVRRKCRLSLRAAQDMSKEEKVKALTCRADVGVKERGYVSACQSMLLRYHSPSRKGESFVSQPSGGRDGRAKAGIVFDGRAVVQAARGTRLCSDAQLTASSRLSR